MVFFRDENGFPPVQPSAGLGGNLHKLESCCGVASEGAGASCCDRGLLLFESQDWVPRLEMKSMLSVPVSVLPV